MTPIYQSIRSLFAGAFTTLSVFALCSFLSPTAAWAQRDAALQMPLGNPDHAKADSASRDHFLIRRPQYALSYDDTLHFPNWVAWHLSSQDLGPVGRGKFVPDTSLPPGFTVIMPADYTRSHYDRGHNCPSGDRTDNTDDNEAVFLMTNMTPQAHGLNAGPWELLEIYCRDLAKQGDEMFITCGHWFSSPKHGTIGHAQIAVPDFGWKIVVVVPSGPGAAVSRINATTRVIAVKMPNINTVSKKDWREFRTSVGDIEKATGLSFFDALPRGVAAAMKNRVDFDQSAPSKMRLPAGTAVPAPTENGAPATVTTGAAASGQVWVNTRSGAYWRPGTQYYGKTKQGKYMSEADAIKVGYHAAGGQ